MLRGLIELFGRDQKSVSTGLEEQGLDEAREIKGRITRLEQELKALQEGLLSSGGAPLRQLTDEDKVELAKSIREGAISLSDSTAAAPAKSTLDASSPPSPKSQESSAQLVSDIDTLTIKLPLFEEDDVSLAQLNACLRQAARNTSDREARRELWRWYSRCKQSLPSLLHIIPETAWTVLWASQQHVSPSNRDRAAHLRVLAEDMLTSGRPLDDKQKLSYIDSLFVEGQVDRALQLWEANTESLGADEPTLQEYWALGVRMYAAQDLPQKAQDTASKYLSRQGGDNVRIVVPVIEAWARQRDDSRVRIAWSLYVRLKARLGEDMSMEDYDKVSMSFMNAGRTDLALAVFKDMMLTGTATPEESTTLYSKALGVVGDLQTNSTNASGLNDVSLSALTILPRRFQNKFFYGSWLKKLIGMGEVDAAALVIELMYERGVRPDAKHLNGIIGAWLRIGNADSRKRAERMGWAMIQERLDLVGKRHKEVERGDTARDPSVQVPEGSHIPPFLRRTVVPATVETFSILVPYYSRRAQYSIVGYLQQVLASAELSPNTYFMNHLLYSELRKRDYARAWELFAGMNKSAKADLETFACLWDCEKQLVDTSRVPKLGYFPNPRRLFGAMMTWYSHRSSREQPVVREEFTKELYDQVIRCFSLSKDLEGTVVAMHAMRQSFGMFPDHDTARMIALHISRLKSSESRSWKTRHSRLARSSNSKADLAKITKILEMLTERRLKTLTERGINIEDMNQAQQADELLHLLSELLRVVMNRMTGEASIVENNIGKAAWEMGVGGITIEDHLDSSRS
ncbi:hypothetical protein MMC16_000417 [Acarospora aff. strigata]|nr:hypothetical protein [Acarospora aff. strigata]